MRIIAVPLARSVQATQLPYVTFLAQKSLSRSVLSEKPGTRDGDQPAASSGVATAAQGKPSWTHRFVARASDYWTNMGRTDVKSLLDWKRRTYVMGEMVMDRIAFEEWALKGIDQALGPSIKNLREYTQRNTRSEKLQRISLLYPPSLVTPDVAVASLRSMVARREPHHYRYLILNIIGVLATAPLFLVPALPNVPTYYLLWRTWSHWRAYMATKSLSSVLDERLIEATPDEGLDQILKHTTEDRVPKLKDDWQVVLHPSQAKQIQAHYSMSDQADIDLRRACNQAVSELQDRS